MKEQVLHIDTNTFSDSVEAACGIDVSFCYQCGKCASGCPVAYEMDMTPTQLMHSIQLGLKDVVYESKTMWLCASCQTCTTRCPQGVDIAEAMDTVKILIQRDKGEAQLPDVLKFNQSFVENLKWFGRLYEIGMIGVLKFRTLKFTQDLGMGIEMIKKQKFSFLPRFHNSREVRKIFKRIKKLEKV